MSEAFTNLLQLDVAQEDPLHPRTFSLGDQTEDFSQLFPSEGSLPQVQLHQPAHTRRQEVGVVEAEVSEVIEAQVEPLQSRPLLQG